MIAAREQARMAIRNMAAKNSTCEKYSCVCVCVCVQVLSNPKMLGNARQLSLINR